MLPSPREIRRVQRVPQQDLERGGTYGPLAGASLKVDNSYGLAAHAGVDFRLGERWLATADLYWIDIQPDVKVNGGKVGTVKIDPLVYGLSLGYRF